MFHSRFLRDAFERTAENVARILRKRCPSAGKIIGNVFQNDGQRFLKRRAMFLEPSFKVVNYVKEEEVIYKNTLRKGKKCVPLRRFKSGLWPNGCNYLIVWL